MIGVEYIFVGAAVLLLLSIFAIKTSGRVGVPALLFFLIIGMVAGSEGLGGIHFDDPWLAQSIGVLALAIILFSGGLDTDGRTVRPVLWKGISLSTPGVVGTAGLMGLFSARLLNLSVSVGLLVSLFLMFIARPLSVLAILFLGKMSFREKTMVSWIGLRGAVPIVLATFPLLAGVPNAGMIFDIIFFIVLSSVLLQGTSIPMLARWLKVDAPLLPKTQPPLEIGPSCNLKNELIEITIPPDSAAVEKQVVELGLPPGTLIVGAVDLKSSPNR